MVAQTGAAGTIAPDAFCGKPISDRGSTLEVSLNLSSPEVGPRSRVDILVQTSIAPGRGEWFLVGFEGDLVVFRAGKLTRYAIVEWTPILPFVSSGLDLALTSTFIIARPPRNRKRGQHYFEEKLTLQEERLKGIWELKSKSPSPKLTPRSCEHINFQT